MQIQSLIEKYAGAVPRYTSYPTVPYWDADTFNKETWLQHVKESFNQSNAISGISLYIHLPYCESLCTYCGCNTRITKNHAVEKPYIKAVAKEWELYKALFDTKPVIKELHLGGGTPTFFSPEHLQNLIESILSACTLHPDAEFSFEAHPANTTVEHLNVLYKLGFKRLSLGIQDFDPKVQAIINRYQTVEQVNHVHSNAKDIGYNSINYDLIYGLPLQTLSGLEKTINSVIKLSPDRIAFYGYAHVPWVKPGQRKFTEADLPNTQERQALYELGRKMLIEAGYREIGMDHFALSTDSLYQAQEMGKLHRNFMGYTHQYTQLMIGLGVSSISDTWTAFAQNVKKVEDYLKLIAENEIPVVKGHILTEEDLLMRKHILSLMCKSKTAWSHSDLLNDSFRNSLDLLPALAEDGLICINERAINVTKTGERFLRNICAVFDARLQASTLQENIFSNGN
ncbi:oxygen-independent coproporphyrinogen III oxidase [Pelobium manganitolerans]|uniref:Coproporphyrinogen-III oxidase n=1 Tax=Pelobium manganitolerans TaxID=1842495 RepID=A0A419S5U3_9SPHI|nr:oxygen-independent coproporphyrinogen III oxidase [Pelobium manganitolerans]RKD16228.1 oxygen-independent coproporphyrinogen III oxidase [Pelobium manganitolerans]